jgi:signal transduction histidine kinase
MVERLGADSIEDVIGKSDFDFWDSESATQFYEVEQEIIRSREPTGARTESGVRANGEVMWSLMSKMPLIDDHGKVVGTFGINKDITIQKQFEEQLEATNKELIVASRRAGMAEVATNVLHNVGNVINSINVSISQADEISRRLKIDNLQKVAKMITDNASNRDYLTDDLKGQRIPEYLTLITKELKKDKEEVVAELESAKRHLEHIKNIVCMQQEYATASSVNEEIDLAEILEDAIRMSSGSLERHRIQLIREFDAGMVVFIDKHRVLQILVNLIRNAKHAMKATDRDDKQMIVSVAKDQVGMVAISVKDNGIGISPDNLTNLFNHGFTTKKGGHGFGLHSGANFARQLGGSLIAESAGLGHGATFTLTLPIVVDDSSDSSTLMPVLHADSGVFDHHSDFSV